MRLGLNQPYFFPYIGHFSLIQHVDRYIIDDVVQFTDKSWMTRNRILNAQNGWQYILVPVKRHSSKSPIYEIEIDNEKKWQIKLLKQMDYYRRAPYFHARGGGRHFCGPMHLFGGIQYTCDKKGMRLLGHKYPD